MGNYTLEQLAEMPEKERNMILNKRKLLKQYKEKHPYKISKQSDGRYHTYLPTKPKRTHISKASIDEIDDILFEFYYSYENRYTFRDVFNMYAHEKVANKEWKDATEDRYTNCYKRYFEDDEFCMSDKIVEDVSEDELYLFITKMINKYSLPIKEFQLFRTIIRGIYMYAVSSLKLNVFSISFFFQDRDFHYKFMSSNNHHRAKNEEVYTLNEFALIKKYCLENLDIQNIGILMDFDIGLRAGELSALKYEDFVKVEDGGEIYYMLNVYRTETKVKSDTGDNKCTFAVEEHTKSEAGTRCIVISEDAYNLAQKARKLNPNGEYLLMTQNGTVRQRGNYFNKRLRSICKKLKICYKPSHKIRKHYASILLSSGVDDVIVQNQMGHADIETTRKYYLKDTSNIAEKNAKISQALKGRL